MRGPHKGLHRTAYPCMQMTRCGGVAVQMQQQLAVLALL
jgi:hypothetical protein